MDVPDTSGQSKHNIGPPEGGPKIKKHLPTTRIEFGGHAEIEKVLV